MRKSICFTLCFITLSSILLSNIFFLNYKNNDLQEKTIPYENYSVGELVQVVDAVFYTLKDENSDIILLELAGVYTECISSAKFCVQQAANTFVQTLVKESDDGHVYYVKDENSDDALIWVKHDDEFYLINLFLIFNKYAFEKDEKSELLRVYMQRYNELSAPENGILNTTLGGSD